MKLKRLFFLILGCVCLALGCVGIVLPVLPTVPFFLATVFCFANSSEKLHTWFLGTELYQKHLDSFVKKKGMTAQTKAGILMSVTLLMAVGFFLMLRKALYIPCTILAIVSEPHNSENSAGNVERFSQHQEKADGHQQRHGHQDAGFGLRGHALFLHE